MVDVAGNAAPGHLQRAAGDVGHVDERPHAGAAAFQFQFLPSEHAVDGPGDDAVERLAWAADIGRPRERHRKPVGLLVGQEVHVAGRLRYGVGRARVERGGFFHEAACAPVDLRRGDLHELLEKVHASQAVHEPGGRDHVGLIPVVGVVPALGHHALGGEVDDVFRLRLANHRLDPIEIAVEVEGVEREAVVWGPRIGQQRLVGLRRAADADHLRAVGEGLGHERGAGERVAAEDDEGFGSRSHERHLRWTAFIVLMLEYRVSVIESGSFPALKALIRSRAPSSIVCVGTNPSTRWILSELMR